MQLMSVDPLEMSQMLASLPFRLGGMGLANSEGQRGRLLSNFLSVKLIWPRSRSLVFLFLIYSSTKNVFTVLPDA